MVQPISEIIDYGEGQRPVIVEFQNSELQEAAGENLETGIYKKDNSTVVALASKKILYTGELNKHDDGELCHRFLLIVKKRTGKVRLVHVDTVTVAPQVSQKSQPKDAVDSSALNPNSSISQLNKEFGSKKIKRITEQRERLKMNIEDVKEQLEQTVAGVEMNESESFMVESSENDSAYRPPINRNASRREDVYVLGEIVPEHVLDSLEEQAAHVLSSDLENLDLSPFIQDKMADLQNSSSDDVMNKANLFLYIDYLIKYISKPAKNITKKVVVCDSSSEVNSHILDNFSVTSNTGRTRPLSMRDKTICYILVLSMIACDYKLDVESLSKNVKLGVKKLQEMCRILAFSAAGKDKNQLVLQIPLPPAVSLSPMKKRKR